MRRTERILLTAAWVIVAAFAMMFITKWEDAAMAHCQTKMSYDTCHQIIYN